MIKLLRILLLIFCGLMATSIARTQQLSKTVLWTADGKGIYEISQQGMSIHDLSSDRRTTLVTADELTPTGKNFPLKFSAFQFSEDGKLLLIFTNTEKVWRYHTRGEYWLFNLNTRKLKMLGNGLPERSLMFAKISPDGSKVAYVSGHNLYSEDIDTHKITQLTTTGTRKFINGTFDWVYEEEFGCRDGFRWSPDSKRIAYWEVDATKIRDYYMLNTTDSPYSRIIPVEYPKVGESPSPVRIGVIQLSDKKTTWMKVPGDPAQHYIPRMEWTNNSQEIVLQQLNRKQNQSLLFYCNVLTGAAQNFYTEKDDAFIDIKSRWNRDDPTGWDWMNHGKEFLWVSEKNGYRQIYKISKEGKNETLVTKGNYDIQSIECIDEKNGYVYFMASPDNATQLYLFRTRLDGKGTLEPLSDPQLKGSHKYVISPNALYAKHSFSSHNTLPITEWINMTTRKPLDDSKSILRNKQTNEHSNVEFFKVTTDDGITVDAWLIRPVNFDSTKKYPVVFYVYGEPAQSTVIDAYGEQENFLFNGNLSIEGYFAISVDNRGTPSLRGREWRKSLYGKLGQLNVRDIAMAASKILEKPYFDKDRVAVWGWSGGGSSTMHLMFQYPEIFKTGIAIAAVTNLLYYDNIYEERYMGLPSENMDNYIKGSAVTYAKNLKGNLLFIHGTGDDNVHYDNAELMLNELVKYGKQFQFMSYPNRTHGLSEGVGTFMHLSKLYSDYLRKYCPPGAK